MGVWERSRLGFCRCGVKFRPREAWERSGCAPVGLGKVKFKPR